MSLLRTGLTVAALLSPFVLAACAQQPAATTGQATTQTNVPTNLPMQNGGFGTGQPLPGSFPGGFSAGTINPETGTRTGGVR